MSNEAEIASIADALDNILIALADHPRPRGRLRMLTYEDLAATTEHAEVAEEIIADPVGRSLRLGIEALGERLHEIGGLKAMGAVMTDVVARRPEQEAQRTDIIDKRWDGIGEWLA